jgi:hypothetical protein
MTLNSAQIIKIFIQSIADWHTQLKESRNPFAENSPEYLLYKKNQIDTIQWHEEDEIRRPDLPIEDLVKIKRNIDRLNQIRTDTVEKIDDWIVKLYENVSKKLGAKMNSETPAWLIDRMSILELKIWHMKEQTQRSNATPEHIEQCTYKLNILLEQRTDLSICLDELLADLSKGEKFVKVYRQMKMYNDKALNPSLYNNILK